MNLMTKAVAAVLLTAAAGTASAQLAPPTFSADGWFRANQGTVGTNTTPGSTLLLSVWDPQRSVGIVVNLGYRAGALLTNAAPSISQPGLRPDDLTAPYVLRDNDANGTQELTLDFGTIPGWSVFASSQAANIRWNIVAADGLGSQGSATNNVSFLTTGPITAGTGFTNLNSNVNGVITAVNTFVNQITTTCATASFCSSASDPAGPYPGQISWGERFNGQVVSQNPSGQLFGTTGALPDVLGFYAVSAASGTATTSAVTTQVANVVGPSRWLLTQSGYLTYDLAPVPLPAAAWLLISGLLGLGFVGRRKASAAATAA